MNYLIIAILIVIENHCSRTAYSIFYTRLIDDYFDVFHRVHNQIESLPNPHE